jgi:hypothetical protein
LLPAAPGPAEADRKLQFRNLSAEVLPQLLSAIELVAEFEAWNVIASIVVAVVTLLAIAAVVPTLTVVVPNPAAQVKGS